MADRDPEQDNLFKEIDEDLRQQKYADLWKKYGKFVIGAAVALVVGVASIKGWQAYDLNRKSEDSKLLASALKSIARDKPDTASGILAKLAQDGSSGYAVLARFNQAAILAKKGDGKAASGAYLALSDDSSIDEIMRDMALIMAALHGIESGDAVALSQKLTRLINGTNAWRHSAKELSALLAQKSGDKAKAQKLYKELSDDATAPSGIRTRAAEMTAILGG
ncbi:MAG: tetratricopeptide repeat protein [Rhodospirillaceae bacterium]|jgi:hypothetical protein|nr:tetratricopeptide repeat protein [Rhodospirillaceae bacterium]MBT4939053.1 tetratricopeptide repeat protein [Rhodospirillaceae bacterium]MBT5941176.1 tetratricopeptide repeat protein [Rhodospirillaceae bacterium]MBT7265375.1 tetratricopeptide repeat protein [Rhodospirillaceae bacterium]